jgi:hypothetical protein
VHGYAPVRSLSRKSLVLARKRLEMNAFTTYDCLRLRDYIPSHSRCFLGLLDAQANTRRVLSRSQAEEKDRSTKKSTPGSLQKASKPVTLSASSWYYLG